MIIPSIDLMGGSAVQLVGGDETQKEIDGGDPRPLATRFGRASTVAVIDLDAAMGKGTNAAVVDELLERASCRVGGGIRSIESALHWLDRGAQQVIVGTAADPEFLRQLPQDRVMVALDARHGEVQVEGWKKGIGQGIAERMDLLREYCGAFLVTFIENEGRLGGTQLERVEELRDQAAPARLTIAGGVTEAWEIAELDRLGVDAQVGMALYSGRLDFAEAVMAPLRSDRDDGLWPTVVVDEHGVALGLVYSSPASVRASLEEGRGIYHSRSRGGLWRKGESSGNTQELLRIDVDCDRDALRFTVRQRGVGFCHLERRSCFGGDRWLGTLERRLQRRSHEAPAGSYTKRLFDDPELLAKKIVEEAHELVEARGADSICAEAADVFYFTLVRLKSAGLGLEDLEKELHRRSLRVRRRGGDAKK